MSRSTRENLLDPPRASESQSNDAFQCSPEFISINVCGLRNSWPDLINLVQQRRPLGVLMSETLVSPSTFDTQHKIPGYCWIVPPRAHRGVALLLSTNIGYTHMQHLDHGLMLMLNTGDVSFLLLGGHQSPNENGFLHELLSPTLTYLQQHPDTDILLIGDFNARHTSHCSRTNALGRLLLDVSDTLGIRMSLDAS